jgi:hypothetical protein
MQRIQFFRVNILSSKAMIIFGLLVLILGLTGLILNFNNGFNSHRLSDWIFIIHILQGLFFIKWGFSRLVMRQYFIEWDEHKLRYLIPGRQQETEIAIDHIRSVTFAHSELNIHLMNDEKNAIPLKDIHAAELDMIKHKFQNISESFTPGQ